MSSSSVRIGGSSPSLQPRTNSTGTAGVRVRTKSPNMTWSAVPGSTPMVEERAPSSSRDRKAFWLRGSLPQMAAMSERSPLKMV